ncbi:MAG TPA: SDR family oxidoreductase [Beijerinckiaceae bacterium]|nr:SDR family oxidoreductase [Beijerinckiaceae bacterium]
MSLFVFGLGYSARAFVDLERRRFTRIVASVTSAEKAERLAAEGIDARVFGPEVRDPRIPDDLRDAGALLVSIPPGEDGDPALAAYADAIAAAPRLAWIGYLSTVGVYGDHGGAWIDETTTPNPTSARSRRRLAAEEAWLALGRRTGKPVQVFRLAGIYGRRRNPLAQLAAGTATRIVKPGQVFNRIHVDDIAAALAASLDRPRPGAVYNVADDEPAPPQDVVAYAASLAGVAPPPEIPFAQASLSPMARSFYAETKRVSNRLLKQELGLTLRYPTYREGLAGLRAAGEGP